MTGKKTFAHRHILAMDDLSAEDISLVLDTAANLKEISKRAIKKVPTLRGRTVINLFFEPSTRTRMSFEVAAKRLSADTFNFSATTSSTSKGETLLDTVRTLVAMHPDAIVLRHSASGAAALLVSLLKKYSSPRVAVINGGDGVHEHPTQALLDLMTIREAKGTIAGLKVAIVGDISHSRVAHSNITGLSRMGAEVRVCGPLTMIPPRVEELGAKVFTSPREAVTGADVVMTLRVQKERLHGSLVPSLREYAATFGINAGLLAHATDDVVVMHPGPLNRGVEIDPAIADSPFSLILDQVENGVAVRMALLFLLLGGKDGD